MAAAQPARRSRMARPDREEQVLAVAHELFAQRGYGAVTMDEIAAGAGVTKPLLYAYFGNKERLYLELIERSAEAIGEMLADPVARAQDDPGEALRDGLRAFFAFVEQHRDRWRLLYDETLPAGGEVAERVAAQREALAALVATMIERLVDPRVATPGPAADALAHALLGAAESLARWWLRTGALPAAETAELLIAALQPGIRAAAQAAGSLPTEETNR